MSPGLPRSLSRVTLPLRGTSPRPRPRQALPHAQPLPVAPPAAPLSAFNPGAVAALVAARPPRDLSNLAAHPMSQASAAHLAGARGVLRGRLDETRPGRELQSPPAAGDAPASSALVETDHVVSAARSLPRPADEHHHGEPILTTLVLPKALQEPTLSQQGASPTGVSLPSVPNFSFLPLFVSRVFVCFSLVSPSLVFLSPATFSRDLIS
jgi:hypothetical protein